MKKTIILILLLLLIGTAYAVLVLTLKDSMLPLYALILGIAMLAAISILKVKSAKKTGQTTAKPAGKGRKRAKKRKTGKKKR